MKEETASEYTDTERLLWLLQYPSPPTTFYAVGDRVVMKRVGQRWNGKLGRITHIDGGCYNVRPQRYKHEIELYYGEFEKA